MTSGGETASATIAMVDVLGCYADKGVYLATLRGGNDRDTRIRGGSTMRKLFAPTPPMGWNSWNTFGWNINEELIRTTAESIAQSGECTLFR